MTEPSGGANPYAGPPYPPPAPSSPYQPAPPAPPAPAGPYPPAAPPGPYAPAPAATPYAPAPASSPYAAPPPGPAAPAYPAPPTSYAPAGPAYPGAPAPYPPGYPAAGGYAVPAGQLRPAAPRPGDGALGRPVAVEAVPGTQFGLAIVGVAPTTSGPAVASLVAGIGSILVSTVVGCFGLLGAGAGWGPTVSGAFAVLAGLAGMAAIALGLVGRSQIRRSEGWRSVTGKGLAMAGIICGAVGVGLTVFSFVAAVALIIRD